MASWNRLSRVLGVIGRVAIILGACILLARCAASGAPAPMPKPDRGRGDSGPPSPCVMKWGWATYDAVFAKGGHYHSTLKNAGDYQPRWEGSWATDGKCIVIHERRADVAQEGGWHEYKIDLDSLWKGKLPYAGGVFSLTKNGED